MTPLHTSGPFDDELPEPTMPCGPYDDEPRDDDEQSAAKGIIAGLCLSAPFWIVAAAFIVRRWW